MEFTSKDIETMSPENKAEAMKVVEAYLNSATMIFDSFVHFCKIGENIDSLNRMVNDYNAEQNEDITVTEAAMVVYIEKLQTEYRRLFISVNKLN